MYNMNQKRKFDGQSSPNKKSRPDHGRNERQASEKGALPKLPSIELELETVVFTHQGMLGAQHSHEPLRSYERLEFIGDAYIEAMATRLIWDHFKTLPAGRLSQIREILVKNETLGEYAVMYGFDKRVNILPGVRDNHKAWAKVKGDIFEAYVAAIILTDPVKGFQIAEDWLTQLWLPKLKDVKESGPNLKAKEDLAKTVMAKGIKLEYVDESPPVQLKCGMQTYFIGVYLTGWGWVKHHLGSGKGLNKVGAGNEAATKALENKPMIDQILVKRKASLDKAKAEKEAAEKQRSD